jgi:hypothetical protein
MKTKFKLLSEETNRILELNSKLNKRISLNESTPRNLTVTVKNDTGGLISGAVVMDSNSDNNNGAATDVSGKAILTNFKGNQIKISFVGFKEKLVDIQDSQNSVDVILETQEMETVNKVAKRPAKIQVIDSTTRETIGNVKIILTGIDSREKEERYTDNNGIFILDYEKYKPLVSVIYNNKSKSFNLKREEGDFILKDKIYKTIELNSFYLIKIQLNNSETDELIPITQNVLDNIKIIVDDSSAINSKVNINKKLTIVDGDEITLDFNSSHFSDSTKLIVKLGGYLASSVPLTSEPTKPIVVTLTKEPEPVENAKLPKGIKLGMVYESEELYDVMQRWLGLCGTKYWEK